MSTPIPIDVTVRKMPKDVIVIFKPLTDGKWAVVQYPGWTFFGDTPEDAFAKMQFSRPMGVDNG